MDIWIEKEQCTGCEACYNSCVFNAIEMIADHASGFHYPYIDNTKCTNCGSCKRSCPLINEKSSIKHHREKYERKSYYAKSYDDNLRFNSTSGGVFSEISKIFIKNGGIVFGAAYDENLLVYHKDINDEQNIKELRQSKYIQSIIGKSYVKVKSYLKQKKKVLFVGSPCQIAGLYQYLGDDNKNLYTIEFICLGVNSPTAYKKWIEEIENENESQVKRVWFKYKVGGWRASPYCTRLDLNNGKIIVLDKENNYFQKAYLQGSIFLRPSCNTCQFMGSVRVADMTFGDFWGLDKTLDDDMGTSIVIINSDKGAELFTIIKECMDCGEVSMEEVVKGNTRLNNPVARYKYHEQLYKDLAQFSFSTTVKKHIGKNELKHRIKVVIFTMIRKIKEKLNITPTTKIR